MSPSAQRCKGMRFLKPQGKKKIGAVGFNLRSLEDTNHGTTRSLHRTCFQPYFIVKPTIITLNALHRNEKFLGDVSFYTFDPILTLSQSTSLTSGLLCDHCLHNHVSRNVSSTRSCFDLSLCPLNRTRRNRHNFYCKSISETVRCK